MMTIRDFIYLDSGRMYSLYSQVFEGVAESVVKSYTNRHMTENSVSKSRDIAGSTVEEMLNEVESKVMYDHLYNQLEKKLESAIQEISRDKIADIETIKNGFLFKVVGRVIISDYNRLIQFTENFNKIGEIIAYSIISDLEPSQRAATNVKKIAKDSGLAQDNTLLNNLKFISEFFNSDSLDVLIDPCIESSNIAFNGILDKQHLRIDEDRLRRLFSSEPNIQWTMVGQLTHIYEVEETDEAEQVENEQTSISDSFYGLVHAANSFEKKFSESQKFSKIHLAPIAIYIEKSIDI